MYSIFVFSFVQVDLLYLDNTFSEPSCIFPPREVCQEEIIKIAKGHPQHDILIGVRSLGKESLLAAIGVALNEDVIVTSKTLQVYRKKKYFHGRFYSQ